MKVDGVAWRPIWDEAEGGDWKVLIIDQTKLPQVLETTELHDVAAAERAIRDMLVRGAPLIGATAAYGMALAMKVDPSDACLEIVARRLGAARPTAINLRWAIDRCRAALTPLEPTLRASAALAEARALVEEDVALNHAIGQAGLELIKKAAAAKSGPVNILTHCNAGWLATCDWGTATAPIYLAREQGIDVHVWVDETRPRLQGAALTAWELGRAGVPHSVIVDNAGGHLMQRGEVDLCLVGTDRVTRAGDVCNKIGTYLKALAAYDTGVPFYVCLPSPTIDWTIRDGLTEIPIEYRDEREVLEIQGVRIAAEGSPAENPGFDVTPARLVTGLVTERGVTEASESGLKALFSDLS